MRPLAERGNAAAQYSLGVMCENGSGLPQDYAEAFKWYRRAADQGLIAAQKNLGVMYANGRGVSQDYAEAFKWFGRAADQGYASAQFNLGLMYQDGTGVPQDYAEAFKWYRKAADQGHPLAQTTIGLMYQNGTGVPQDYAEALKWYRKAAEKGGASTQSGIAWMYATGTGVPQDYAEALKWGRKAADQGDAKGQAILGQLFANGQGVLQNYVLAHMWWNLASAAQNAGKDVKKYVLDQRVAIERKMTPQQIAQAQALAAEWRPILGKPNATDNGGEQSVPSIVEPVSTGTGFFVSQDGYLLTNHHVIEGCASLRLYQPGTPPQRAKTVARDPSNDLALLKAESRASSVAELSSRKRPQLGQAVVLYGFPLSGVLSSSGNLTTGTVSALTGINDDSRLFQITAPVQPGNSGGPVLDATGSVLGVVISKLNARAVERETSDIPQNVNFAIKGAVAAGFLDSNGVDYLTDSGSQTIPVEEVAKRATRFTVRVECLR